MSGKKSKRPASHSGSSLTDAVVAALAEVDDQTEAGGEPAPAAEAGCAQTDQQAKGAAKQTMLGCDKKNTNGPYHAYCCTCCCSVGDRAGDSDDE